MLHYCLCLVPSCWARGQSYQITSWSMFRPWLVVMSSRQRLKEQHSVYKQLKFSFLQVFVFTSRNKLRSFYLALKRASCGGTAIWLQWPLNAFLLGSIQHVQLEGEPGAEPKHAGEIIYPIWPGNISGPLQLPCVPLQLGPGQVKMNEWNSLSVSLLKDSHAWTGFNYMLFCLKSLIFPPTSFKQQLSVFMFKKKKGQAWFTSHQLSVTNEGFTCCAVFEHRAQWYELPKSRLHYGWNNGVCWHLGALGWYGAFWEQIDAHCLC